MNKQALARCKKYIFPALGLLLLGAVGIFAISVLLPTVYEVNTEEELAAVDVSVEEVPKEPPVTHLKTPEFVRALYMTSCIAGTPSLRKRLVSIAEETEVNAFVIDIKDYSGNIAFSTKDPRFKDAEGLTCTVSDMREFISALHEKDIYVIGRITVFQDPHFAKKHPNIAVQKESDKTTWEDYKGISFIDAGAREYWDYIVELSHESYNVGFDELNFDYIRFPSDGNMRDIYYPVSEEIVLADPDFGKAHVVKDFFAYLYSELKQTGAVLSADMFGMVATNSDDLNIGQTIEFAEPYFDYIAPMVYPSHYPKGFNGHQNVNAYSYEIVKFSMDQAVKKLYAASSTPEKLRPWLQDFDYPVPYTPEMVKAQIQAVYDAGLDSWMLWDPTNQYTREILLPNE
ncbi:hypothetical protein CL630_01515 [bacterium]|nr:hypothetical protein [bacterium]|tara:strand:- start:449 stop:1648 length:1200 start_codon:yes stop_codon:yes gene_type:complete